MSGCRLRWRQDLEEPVGDEESAACYVGRSVVCTKQWI